MICTGWVWKCVQCTHMLSPWTKPPSPCQQGTAVRSSWHKLVFVLITLHLQISVYCFSPVTGELLADLDLNMKEVFDGFQAAWEPCSSPGWREVGMNMNICTAWVWHWCFSGMSQHNQMQEVPQDNWLSCPLGPSHPFPSIALARTLPP